jgi:hypothetical protein
MTFGLRLTCACVLVGVLPSAACGGSSAEPDAAGMTSDAGTDASDLAIDAPDDQWTWVDFPESKCGAGTPTGLAVNPHAGATETLIFFQGGGGCTNGAACWGSPPKATYMSGFGLAEFNSAPTQQRALAYPILTRSAADNPFKAMNMVFIPYCTGDLHTGSGETDLTFDGMTIPTYFWGAKDVSLFLERLVPTFHDTDHVWIAGVSAGGFGSFVSFDAIAGAFSGARVDIVDDSGPPILPNGASSTAAFSIWHYQPPADCGDCTGFPAIYAHARASQPASSYALLGYAEDTTISADFGYTLAEYRTAIGDFKASIASDPHAFTFIVDNTVVGMEKAHVVQSDPALAPQYLPWLTQMVTDDPAWSDRTYTP